MQNFSELPISTYMKERLAAGNFVVPTPVQAAAIPQAMELKDVLATAQTGTGKTLAFLIPVMEKLLKEKTGRGVAALVLVPTRELAMQVEEVYDTLRGKQLVPAAVVVGGLSEGKQLQMLRKGARLIVATPGRLEDFLHRKLIQFGALHTLVLDEADRMLDMGFYPAIKRIVSVLPKQRQTLCFSATMEGEIAKLVKEYMLHPVRLTFGSTTKPSESVKIQAIEVPGDRKQGVLQGLLMKEKGRVLIFARTKRGTDKLARNLNKAGIAAAMIHGDRSQAQRSAALAGFQQGRFRVLVATDVASRGIHVQDIAHVINYDLPDVAENFIHRVGRTGRAGEVGLATTLYERGQRRDILLLEKTLGIHMEKVVAENVPADKFESARSDVRHTDAKPSGVRSHFARQDDQGYGNSRNNSRQDSPRYSSRPGSGHSRDSRHGSSHKMRGHASSGDESSRARMISLPGEVLQVQAGN
jgi:ATP-dependent RNA helicase RhlE